MGIHSLQELAFPLRPRKRKLVAKRQTRAAPLASWWQKGSCVLAQVRCCVRMKTLSFVTLAFLTGCNCSTGPNVGSDLGIDADFSEPDASPNDASDAGEDDVDVLDVGRLDVPLGRDVGPNPARGHRPSMQVFDRVPCEPWETLESPPRGLPSDTTPRVLWTYQPGLDPNDEPEAHFRSRVRTPVVSPDGTIWVHGPDFDQISQLNRDGTMRNWFEVGGRDFEDENSQRLGDISVAPNGDALAIIYVRNPEQRGFITRVDPVTSTTSNARGGLQLDPNSRLAISPDGMVYAISQNRVYGLCHGDRHMWTLTNLAEDGERDFYNSAHFGPVFVQPNGTLLLSGYFAETYEVNGTEITTELLFDVVDTSFYRSIHAIAPAGSCSRPMTLRAIRTRGLTLESVSDPTTGAGRERRAFRSR